MLPVRALPDSVARSIRQECRIGPDDRVAVALSGGPDSVALTWVLHALAPGIGFTIAGLIHVNHQLRGAESDADEAFCRFLAARLDLPIRVLSVDIAASARTQRHSLEVAARNARYAFFETAAADLNASVVVTGHTMDDQAETVLLRLLRGAGARGLSGIRVRRGLYARPLLSTRRDALRAYLVARGECWREDLSNADIAIPRNRIRRDLIPLLTAITPGAVPALARVAALAYDDETYLMAAAIKNRPALVLSEEGRGGVKGSRGGAINVDASALSLLAPALARRFVRSIAADAAPGVTLSARHLKAVSGLAATDKPGGHLDLPGLSVRKRGDVLTFQRASGAPGRVAAGVPWPARRLDVPGVVAVPEAGIDIVSRAAVVEEGEWQRLEASEVALQAGSVQLPLQVRNRRPGDRFRPLGAPGRRKLQDVLVDRKVPRFERDAVPVVVDAADRIVWVAGVALAHECRVTAPQDGVLILEQRTTE
jgi:tRNA(Ile)-lysidine synthase